MRLNALVFSNLLMLLLMVSGCALSPQKLEPQPLVLGPIQTFGQGQPVVVTAKDLRGSSILGTRGGVYDNTNTVEVSGKTLIPRLLSQAEAGVRLMGFTPRYETSQGAQMQVALVDLKYVASDSSIVTKAMVSTTLQVEIRNQGRLFKGRYQAQIEDRFSTAPNLSENTQWVSQVLTDALTRVFKDPKVGQSLQ